MEQTIAHSCCRFLFSVCCAALLLQAVPLAQALVSAPLTCTSICLYSPPFSKSLFCVLTISFFSTITTCSTKMRRLDQSNAQHPIRDAFHNAYHM